MAPQNQTTSLQRLLNVEKRIVRLLDLAGSVMDELANSTGPRTEALTAHCREFMLSIKVEKTFLFLKLSFHSVLKVRKHEKKAKEIQTTLRDEIKSACEYRPFEKCDYSARIFNEICCKKLEYIIEQLDRMQQNLEQSSSGS